MKNPFKAGDQKTYLVKVVAADFAAFESGTVHEVYATFAMARDAEWSGRLFVLDMKDSAEEGIGSEISIQHLAPAFEGESVEIISTFSVLSGNRVKTHWEAKVGERLIGKGEQEQRILPKEKLAKVFESYRPS